MNPPNNILLIDKPAGITSYDVIRILQQKMGKKKMGHAGTLDPFATGLLIIGLEDGTKRMSEFLGMSKVYEADVLLGVKTDSGDPDGVVLEKSEPPHVSEEEVKKILIEMTGDINLSVPIYSAIKRAGKPLYEYAREGKEITPPKRTMTVISAELLKIQGPIISVRWNVGSGTYIRSLGEEFGRRLGTVASLSALRRTSIGPYNIDQAEKISP